MRESRTNLGTPAVFLAGALCGAALAALFDGRNSSLQGWVRAEREQNIPDELLLSQVRDQLAPVCNLTLVEMEVREGHVNVWGNISHSEASDLGRVLRNAPGVTSYYVQAVDNRDIRDIADEHGIPGRERLEQFKAA